MAWRHRGVCIGRAPRILMADLVANPRPRDRETGGAAASARNPSAETGNADTRADSALAEVDAEWTYRNGAAEEKAHIDNPKRVAHPAKGKPKQETRIALTLPVLPCVGLPGNLAFFTIDRSVLPWTATSKFALLLSGSLSSSAGTVLALSAPNSWTRVLERIPLWNARRGIRRPRQLSEPGAALTIVTAPRVQGLKPADNDEVAADDRGTFGYRYEGTDPNTWTNVALRRAMELNRPLIYLYGVTKGTYEPIFPFYFSAEDSARLTLYGQADAPFAAKLPSLEPASTAAPMREYQTVAVKRRVHQHRFRELVLGPMALVVPCANLVTPF